MVDSYNEKNACIYVVQLRAYAACLSNFRTGLMKLCGIFGPALILMVAGEKQSGKPCLRSKAEAVNLALGT